jgi:NAD:arginine ADP-ribosyltransferase
MSKNRWIATFLLLVTGSARAETITATLVHGRSSQSVPIELLSSKACIAELNKIWDPKSIIQDGLNGLSRWEALLHAQTCMEDTPTEWALGEHRLFPAITWGSFPFPARLKLQAMETQLQDPGADVCTHRSSRAENPLSYEIEEKQLKGHCSRIYSATEGPAIQAEYEKRKKDIKILEDDQIFHLVVANYLFPLEHRKLAGLSIQGKGQGGSELSLAANELRALHDPYQTFFGSLYSFEMYDRDKVLPLARKLICFNPYPREGESRKYFDEYEKSNSDRCRAGWLSDAEATEINDQIRSMLPNLNMANAKILAEEKKAIAKELPAWMEQYRKRRLLALFTAYLRRSPVQSSRDPIADFCAIQEKINANEKEYAAAGLPLYYFTNEQQWAAAQNFGATEAEQAAFLDYTDSRFVEINRALRGTAPRPAYLDVYLREVTSALQRLPTTSAPVFRYSDLPPAEFAKHTLGSVVQYPAFTSTSSDPEWKYSGDFKFKIFGASGHDISPLSTFTHENEVLFPPETRFKVIAIDQIGGQTQFTLIEVDKNGMEIGRRPAGFVNP